MPDHLRRPRGGGRYSKAELRDRWERDAREEADRALKLAHGDFDAAFRWLAKQAMIRVRGVKRYARGSVWDRAVSLLRAQLEDEGR